MNDAKTKTVFEDRENLQRENKCLLDAFERKTLEYVQLRNQLEAAKKVADAAVRWLDNRDNGNDEAEDKSWVALQFAVREYCALAEPLSPGKQAVIERTADKTDEEWQAIISGEVAP
jgi:hypothetical protein